MFSQLQSEIEEICADLTDSDYGSIAADDNSVCSICFSGPEKDERMRLELCGHLNCQGCLRLQVEAAVLPLACVKEVKSFTH